MEVKYKLIVADRSPSVQKAVQLAFPKSEFELYFFEDIPNVMKNLGKILPDALLLSLSLPGKDVYEVGFYLRSQKEFRNTSIFFLRGAFEPLDHQKIASIDYEEIVRKPFDSGKLARTVKEAVEKKRNPLTIPEESILDSSNLENRGAKVEKSALEDDIQARIAPKIERNLEDKVKDQVLKELKEYFQREIDELKEHLSRMKTKSD